MNSMFKNYDKELAQICEICTKQQDLIITLALVSNYDIKDLIALLEQGWHLVPPENTKW